MPLIFASSASTKSGITYADQTGVSYEYPKQYQKMVIPGTQFIYYRPGKPAYFGSGVVGEVSTSESPGRLMCRVLDFDPFATEVPLRDPETGEYVEPHADGQRIYRNGVRTISPQAFARILSLGGAGGTIEAATVADSATRHAYGSDPFTNREVEEFAVQKAFDLLSAEFSGSPVRVMPRNNPGFDLLVGPENEPSRYVEVKGTRRPVPAFFLTEGERAFSCIEADRYEVIVVFDVDLQAETSSTWRRIGAVDDAAYVVSPLQWQVHPRSETSSGVD